MTDDRLFSPATSALLIAMTALQCTAGVEPSEAMRRAVGAWDRHVAEHEHDLWTSSELESLVTHLTRA